MRTAPPEPPPIDGVRRSFVEARGVRFHVTEAGPADGIPVLMLHGWPQHHYAWRHLLKDPPAGLRLIAPDLPGYGWSGPAPHRWWKEEIASDILALMDALGLQRVMLVGHDWGGFVGFLLTIRAPERFSGYMALNIAHPWQTPRAMAPHIWRFLPYQPAIATIGVPLQRKTNFVGFGIRKFLADPHAMTREEINWFADRFRDPVVGQAGRDTYRTFWTRELPRYAVHPESRRSHVPTRMVYGKADHAIHPALAAERTAKIDDYRLELIEGSGHFIADEKPEIVRARLIEYVAQFPPT